MPKFISFYWHNHVTHQLENGPWINRYDIQGARDLSTANIVNTSLYRFCDINIIITVDIYDWETKVVTRMINISIIVEITSGGVDIPSIINTNDKKRDILFWYMIKYLSHTSILISPITNKNNRNIIIIFRMGDIFF